MSRDDLKMVEKIDLPDWTYDGEKGPETWSSYFDEETTGDYQSPIDIIATVASAHRPIVFRYKPSSLAISNNGRTITSHYDSNNIMGAFGWRYELKEMHFHWPSEHTIKGKGFPAELHLLHVTEEEILGVVAIFIEEGEANPEIDKILNALPVEVGTKVKLVGKKIDAMGLLPEQVPYYAYDGSLTTPPCTEPVKWFVFKEPITASAAQIEALKGAFASNCRAQQPTNGRNIYVFG